MSSTSQPPDPLPPNDDRSPQLMAMYWTWSVLSMALLSLRFYTRVKVHGVGWDDWMMLVSVILFLVATCFITYMASVGGARHVWYLSDAQVLEAMKMSWLSQPPAILLFATTKSSIAILTLRLIGKTTFWRKIILCVVIAVVSVANILGIVFTFAQCTPARALWTPGLPASCWDPTVQGHFNYFLGAVNISTDVLLALLPTTFIPKLNLRPKKKLALCILLGLGIIAAIFGAVKVSYLVELTQRADFIWAAYDVQAWSGAEGFVLIFCGNMPPMQPLWERFVANKWDSSCTRPPVEYSASAPYSAGKGKSNDSRSWQTAPMQTASDHALCPVRPDRVLVMTNRTEDRFGEESVLYHTISAEYASHTGTHSIRRTKPGDKLRVNESEERMTPNAVGISRTWIHKILGLLQ